MGTKEGANLSRPTLRHRQAPFRSGAAKPRPIRARARGRIIKGQDKLAVFRKAPLPLFQPSSQKCDVGEVGYFIGGQSLSVWGATKN